MRALRLLRLSAWALVAVLGLGALAATLGWFAPEGPAGRRPLQVAMPAIGGPFSMRDAAGVAVTERDLQGRASLLFFGFTHCPDICPTTMSDIAGWMKELGPAADGLQVLFVTVDPERDKATELAAYAAMFDPRIRALAGTEVIVNGGKMETVRDSGEPEGTQIEARSLFYNLPARRKFLPHPADLGHPCGRICPVRPVHGLRGKGNCDK